MHIHTMEKLLNLKQASIYIDGVKIKNIEKTCVASSHIKKLQKIIVDNSKFKDFSSTNKTK